MQQVAGAGAEVAAEVGEDLVPSVKAEPEGPIFKNLPSAVRIFLKLG